MKRKDLRVFGINLFLLSVIIQLMNQRQKQTEEEARKEYPWKKYHDLCEVILDLELQLKAHLDENLNKLACKDGAADCMQNLTIEKMKIEKALEIRLGEKLFLEKYLKRL